jgi:hypothetical protein
VWTSKIGVFGNYVPTTTNPNLNGIVSVFTPATGITINRIQLQAIQSQKCSAKAGIKVTDGTSSIFLSIPNTARNGLVAVAHDSGVMSVPFAASVPIFLRAVPASDGCNPFEVNIVVQYSVTP